MAHPFRRSLLLLACLCLTLGQAPADRPAAPDATDVAPNAAPDVATPTDDGTAAAADTPEQSPSASPVAAQPASVSPSLASLPSGSNVAVIPVEGVIYDFVLTSLERRIERAVQNGATLIVIELDTFGGVVTSALQISQFLKDPSKVPVPTIAWVHPKAYSAGILIGASCDYLVMSNASATGDCAPIVPGQELAPTERAKAFSPIANEFKNSANANGYTYATFHAMCVLGVELYLIENPATGQRKVVNQADYALMVKGEQNASAGIDVAVPGAATTNANNPTGTQPSTAIERIMPTEYTTADLGQWKPVTVLPSGRAAPDGRIHDGLTLYTVDEITAKDIGLSKATVASDADLSKLVGAATVTRIPQTWSENIAAFLTQPTVRAVLVLALMLGAYVEFQSPGLGFPGAVAVIALVALLGAPFVVGLAEVWHILIFLIGFILLVIELTMTPTFGVLGIVGLIMMLAGLVLSVVPSTGGGPMPTPPPEVWNLLFRSLSFTLFGLAVGFAGMIVLTRYFGSLPLFRRLILADDQREGSLAVESASIAGDLALGSGTIQIGQTGKVVSTLRPAGTAMIAGQEIDVTSTGEYLDIGQAVRVVEVRKFSIVVEAIQTL